MVEISCVSYRVSLDLDKEEKMRLKDMDVQQISQKLDLAILSSEPLKFEGRAATYLPALKDINPDSFAVAIVTADGKTVCKGEKETKFSMQSISKVIDLIVALEDVGTQKVFQKIGTQCTTYPYNSLRGMEEKASNPFVNAGAITSCSLIQGKNTEEKFEKVLNKVKSLSGSETVYSRPEFYFVTDINHSIAYYLKGKGIIDGNVDEILDLYVRNCFIELNVEELAKIGAVLSNSGRDPNSGKQLVEREIIKVALSLMTTCGMYETSGQFLLQTGFPAKSGVSGGIMAVVPQKCGIATYAPRLDETGNSIRGNKILEELAQSMTLNMFVE